MSIYPPPNYTQPLSIFNPANYGDDGDVITKSYLDANYLKFPVAQPGTETLNNIIVNGTSSLNNNLVMSSNDPNESQITCGYLNLKDLNGNVARTAEIYQDSANLIITNEATSGKTRFNNDTTGGIPTLIMELDQPSGITCYRPLTMTANNNFNMSAGTGVIQQSTTTNDISTTNNFKKTTIQYNNSGSTSTAPALEIYEAAGRGVYIVPNVTGGGYGPNTQNNDTCFISRFFAMPTTAMLFATGTSLRNHLRLSATTDLSLCSLVLQNGGNLIGNASEFRMDYNFNNTPQNTISFNNPINFNPTNNGAISSTRRALTGLGTLSFTDISANSVSGSITSSIWTDSSLVSSLNGMYYDCGINGGFHQFIARNASGVASTPIYYGANITSVSNTFIVRNATTPSNRFDTVVGTSQNVDIRARSSTASTDALININCDTVSSGSVVSNNPVLTIAPTYLETRRPIQFNYLTVPITANQLGWYSDVETLGGAFSTQTSPNSMAEIIIGAGTWRIDVNYSFTASANHTHSVFSYGLSTSPTAFPTSLPYTISYIQEPGLNINTTTATRQTGLTLQLASTTSVFVLERVAFTGGGTTNISVSYSIVRIG